MAYAKHYDPNRTPQGEPRPGTVRNLAGGQSYALDDWRRLDAFLVLGSEGGSHYASERALTRDNAKAVERCLASDPGRAVDAIVAVDSAGRAPRKAPALFALALALASPDDRARKAGYGAVGKVCRTGADLLALVSLVDGWRGWSRGLRRAVARWYLDRDVDSLGYQVVKYRDRAGWTHRDVLRMAHPLVDANAPDADGRRAVFDWVAKGTVAPALPAVVRGMEAAKATRDVAATVREYRLPREALDTSALNDPNVWRALLADMPITATVRNLGKMTSVGAMVPLGPGVDAVVAALSDGGRLRKGRVHPLALLLALKAYATGGLERAFARKDGREAATWDPVPAIVDALDRAFYLSFGSVEPCGKRTYLALDVSGSMDTSKLARSQVTAREGAAAMALVTAATEPRTHLAGFTSGQRMVPLAIGPSQRLDDVVRTMARVPFGNTDCALPMLDATAKGMEVDAFVVYTDSETWAGRTHPMEALREYRRKSGISAKLVVVGMTSEGFSIADPKDPSTLDVVGFDAATPALIADFLRS